MEWGQFFAATSLAVHAFLPLHGGFQVYDGGGRNNASARLPKQNRHKCAACDAHAWRALCCRRSESPSWEVGPGLHAGMQCIHRFKSIM
jgi:hypothetical protein